MTFMVNDRDMSRALDRYITGNWGENNVSDDDDDDNIDDEETDDEEETEYIK